MPRNALTDEQKTFVRENAIKGGNWLAQALNVDRSQIYQYATDEGFSVKKGGKSSPEEKRIKMMKRACSSWPKQHKRYKKYLVMRDGLRCHYCDTYVTYDEVQIDHVIAKARGGTDAPHNLVLSCPRCNRYKSTLCHACPEFREAIKK